MITWVTINVEYIALSAFLGWLVIYTINNPRKIKRELVIRAREELAAATELWLPFHELVKRWLYKADQHLEKL